MIFTTSVFLRLFKACHPHLSPKNYILGCEFDSCHMSNPAVACTSLQTYARSCSQLGICINWRNYTNLCSKLHLLNLYHMVSLGFSKTLNFLLYISDFIFLFLYEIFFVSQAFGCLEMIMCKCCICLSSPDIECTLIKYLILVVQLSHQPVLMCMPIFQFCFK